SYVSNLGGREHVVITEINEQIQTHDEKHADDQSQRQIALGLLHFAGEKRDVVPTVISPERSQHRCRETGRAAGGDRYLLAYATDIRLRQMRPVAATVKERTQSDTDQNQNLDRREHGSEAAAEAYRRAVDEHCHADRRKRHQLESLKRN